MTIVTARTASQPVIAYDRCGSGPLLLFLHGIGGHRDNWHDQLAHFGQRFTAVAWDARGYGDSDDVPDPDNHRQFTDFADDLARLIGELGGGPAHLVGLSMGGRIALDMVRRHRALVASLTLADTSAGSAKVQSPEEIAAFLAVRARPLREEGKSPADVAPAIVAGIAGPHISHRAKQRLLDSHARLRTPSYLATLGAVTRFTDFPPFEGLDLPVQVIVGEHDRIATPAHAAAMAAKIPGAKLTTIAHAGHVSNIEAPDAFNAALAAFLLPLLADRGVLLPAATA